MKERFVKMYMDIAEIVAQQSSAKRLKVGSIIVKDDRILSLGYNGTPSGWDNECEYKHYNSELLNDYELRTKPEVIHSEQNCISKLAKSTESGQGATMFLTHAPCLQCAKQIYTAGIIKVYYRDTYRDLSGVEFLTKCGVWVCQRS